MNCPYASSTTTSPGAAASAASTTSGLSMTPVGLLGEQRNVMAGWASFRRRVTSAGSRVKSGRRSPTATAVPVIRGMWEWRA